MCQYGPDTYVRCLPISLLYFVAGVQLASAMISCVRVPFLVTFMFSVGTFPLQND